MCMFGRKAKRFNAKAQRCKEPRADFGFLGERGVFGGEVSRFDLIRFANSQRQPNSECAAFTRRAIDINDALMQLNGLFDDRKP